LKPTLEDLTELIDRADQGEDDVASFIADAMAKLPSRRTETEQRIIRLFRQRSRH
jgi:hypothetical protein